MDYNGETSSSRDLPGGGRQGSYLGGLIFIIKYNGAFLRPPIPPMISGPVLQSKSEKVYYLDDTKKFTDENKMVINSNKSKVMLFNKARKWDFPPEVSFSDNENLEYLSHVKLVGVMISDDLRWAKNKEFICQKAMQRMWIIRRMKKLKLEPELLIDTYTKEIRSVLELAVPVWHGGLTAKQSRDIERVQKTALFIILEDSYINYDVACTLAEIEPLDQRREKLCLKFARKEIKKDNTLFILANTNLKTQSQNVVIEPKCNTRRFAQSSIPYLSRLLNKTKQT